jgi:hypothetical protein
MNDRDDDAQLIAEYAKRVGERLRTIRRQQRMSLQDVEASTNQEFKASVLGAYERGERAISVLKMLTVWPRSSISLKPPMRAR